MIFEKNHNRVLHIKDCMRSNFNCHGGGGTILVSLVANHTLQFAAKASWKVGREAGNICWELFSVPHISAVDQRFQRVEEKFSRDDSARSSDWIVLATELPSMHLSSCSNHTYVILARIGLLLQFLGRARL